MALVDKDAVPVIPANKAYLTTSQTSTNGAKLNLVFDDDATGVSPIRDDEPGTGRQNATYNLAGQRVDSAYKGIVVRNGRKYVNR